MNYKWIRCPRCGYGHFMKIIKETRIVKFPAYCKMCKTESIVTIEPKSQIVNS